jgi:WD40 repeat protein
MTNQRSTTSLVCRLAGGLGSRLVLLAGIIAALWGIESRTEPEEQTARNDQPLMGLRGDAQGAPVWSLAFSPGGRFLASASIPGEVWLQDMSTGRASLLQKGPQSSARSVAFSPDGQVLAAAGSEAGKVVRLWNVQRGEELPPLDLSPQTGIQHIAFRDHGAVLAVGGREGVLSLWDWTQRKRLAVLSGHKENITALAFAPGGSRLASGDSTGEVAVWNLPDQRLTTTLLARESGLPAVTALALSHSGDLVATSCFLDRIVKLWDGGSGRLRRAIPTSQLGATGLAISSDGSMLAVAEGGGSVRLWDLAGNRELAAVQSAAGRLQSLALSGDGRMLATGATNGLVSLWDVAPALKSEGISAPSRIDSSTTATSGGPGLGLISRK